MCSTSTHIQAFSIPATYAFCCLQKPRPLDYLKPHFPVLAGNITYTKISLSIIDTRKGSWDFSRLLSNCYAFSCDHFVKSSEFRPNNLNRFWGILIFPRRGCGWLAQYVSTQSKGLFDSSKDSRKLLSWRSVDYCSCVRIRLTYRSIRYRGLGWIERWTN